MNTKNRFSKIGLIAIALLSVTLSFLSCEKEANNEYVGKNIIYIETAKTTVITSDKNGAIELNIKSVYKAKEDCTLKFKIVPVDEKSKADMVKIVEKDIVMKKGERSTTLHIAANNISTATLGETYTFDISIEKFPAENMELKAPLRFSLFNLPMPVLTDEQNRLLEHYKKDLNIDLSWVIGKLDVSAFVKVPPEGLIEGFINPWEKTYNGFSIITLSEKSTENQPVLKMTYNAMGLNDFYYFGLRKNTIENYEFWYAEYAGPLFKEIMELINWNDKSVEHFTTSLDNIRIKNPENNKSVVDIMGRGKDAYENRIKIVPFTFTYTAWDRQEELIKKNNAKAIECHEQGGSAYPYRYCNNTDITKDIYKEEREELMPTTGEIDFEKKTMKFSFLTSIENGGDYIPVNITYKKKKEQ